MLCWSVSFASLKELSCMFTTIFLQPAFLSWSAGVIRVASVSSLLTKLTSRSTLFSSPGPQLRSHNHAVKPGSVPFFTTGFLYSQKRHILFVSLFRVPVIVSRESQPVRYVKMYAFLRVPQAKIL